MSQQTSFRNRVESLLMAMTTFLRRPFFLPTIVRKKSLKLLQTLKKGFKKKLFDNFFLRNLPKRGVSSNMNWGEPTREMHGKNPSCDHAVHFYFQSREPQSIACRDFIWFPSSCIPYPAAMAKLWTSVCYRFTQQPLQEKHRRFSRFSAGVKSYFYLFGMAT